VFSPRVRRRSFCHCRRLRLYPDRNRRSSHERHDEPAAKDSALCWRPATIPFYLSGNSRFSSWCFSDCPFRGLASRSARSVLLRSRRLPRTVGATIEGRHPAREGRNVASTSSCNNDSPLQPAALGARWRGSTCPTPSRWTARRCSSTAWACASRAWRSSSQDLCRRLYLPANRQITAILAAVRARQARDALPLQGVEAKARRGVREGFANNSAAAMPALQERSISSATLCSTSVSSSRKRRLLREFAAQRTVCTGTREMSTTKLAT